MIKFKCPRCNKEVHAPDPYAGKKGRCPRCQKVFVIPAPMGGSKPTSSGQDYEVVEDEENITQTPRPAVPSRSRPSREKEEDEDRPRRGKKSRTRDEEEEELEEVVAYDEEEEEEVRPRSRKRRPSSEEDEDDFEEEERPRPRPKKKKKRRKGTYADCPNCGSRGYASPVIYTLWGGFVGPLLISTVRCNDCGTSYNGKHGDYNTVRIAIFVGVSLALGAILGVLGVMAKAL